MGLYNTIHCKRKMPDGFDATDVVFQTTELGEDMSHYTITEDDKLFLDDKDLEYHGIIDICTYDKNKVFREYRIKFTDGKIISIAPLKTSNQPT